MKKTSKLNVEYAVMNQQPDIENRSEAVIDDGEYIRSHWQKNIIKHQPPIVQSPSELSKQCRGLKKVEN